MDNNEFENLTGRTFEFATVIGKAYRPGYRHSLFWVCRCDCGNYFYASTHSLVYGRKWHCGCLTGGGKSVLIPDVSQIKFATLYPTQREGYVTVMRRNRRRVKRTPVIVPTAGQTIQAVPTTTVVSEQPKERNILEKSNSLDVSNNSNSFVSNNSNNGAGTPVREATTLDELVGQWLANPAGTYTRIVTVTTTTTTYSVGPVPKEGDKS